MVKVYVGMVMFCLFVIILLVEKLSNKKEPTINATLQMRCYYTFKWWGNKAVWC